MPDKSNIPTYSKQLILPIEFAPSKVRAHGLRDAHTFPLVSQGKCSSGAHSASFRVPAAEAWGFPEIELRAGNSWPSKFEDDYQQTMFGVVTPFCEMLKGELPRQLPFNTLTPTAC